MSGSLLLSVIVPVYNAAPYLRACVACVLRQTFRDFELILVDDGSSDGSGALCDELAACNERVRTLHKPNGGAASARNLGLREAKGARVLFLDADDWYDSDTLLARLAAHDADVVCFNYKKYNAAAGRMGPPKVRFKGGLAGPPDEDLRRLVRYNAYNDSACLKLVRTALLRENEVYFIEGLLGEDIEWNAKLLLFVKTAAFHDGEYYVYRMVPRSASHTYSQKRLDDIFFSLEWMADCRHPRLENETFARAFYGYAAYNLCTTLVNIRLADKGNLAANLNRCQRIAWLLRYDDSPAVKMVRRAARLFGLRFASWLLALRSALIQKKYGLAE